MKSDAKPYRRPRALKSGKKILYLGESPIRKLNFHGYYVIIDTNPFSARNGEFRMEHVVIVEKVLDKNLPEGVVVHHHNKIKTDNRNENLVVCPNQAYHALLHRRMRALEACGNPDWILCYACGIYGDPQKLMKLYGKPVHSECIAAMRSGNITPRRSQEVSYDFGGRDGLEQKPTDVPSGLSGDIRQGDPDPTWVSAYIWVEAGGDKIRKNHRGDTVCDDE